MAREGWGMRFSALMLLLLTGCVPVFQSKEEPVAVVPDVRCVRLTPESELHPVGICHGRGRYAWQALERRWSLDERQFERRLRERIFHFLKGSAYPPSALKSAEIELWMTAPVFAPQEAEFVAVLISPAGNVAFRLPLDPDAWIIDRDRVSLLGPDAYPSRRAKRAGAVMVAAKPHVTPHGFHEFLAANGIDSRRTSEHLVGQVAAPLFAETKVAERLMRHAHAKHYLQAVSLVPAGEREASRKPISRFPFLGR